jgi:hypothetical protein
VPSSNRASSPNGLLEEYRIGMRELGYVEGRTVETEHLYADGNFDRLREHEQTVRRRAELHARISDELFENRLALVQRQAPKVSSVEVKQVERDHYDFGGSALELILEYRKVCDAISPGDNHLRVDDRRACIDVPSVRGNLPKAIGPVVAAASVHLDHRVSEMELQAVAIHLDFVNPPLTAGTSATVVANAGSMKPG